MIGIKVSKTITISTVKDGENGKDGRDAADIVVSPKVVVYPVVDAVCIRTTPKLIRVKYTDSEGTEFSNITQIVSYNAPDGITVIKENTTADPFFYYVQVSIPEGSTKEGTVEVVVNMDNYEHTSHGPTTKTVEGIKFSFDIQQGVPKTIIDQDIRYSSDSLGNALSDNTYLIRPAKVGQVIGAKKLYGADGVQISKSIVGANVTIQKGSNVAGMVICEIKPALVGSYDPHELHQFNFVPNIVPTTYNPNFEDGDQTLADDCSDTVCIHNAKDLDFGQERTLYLPDVEIWEYRRITIYRVEDDRQPGMLETYPYIIYIKSQSGEDIWDYRVPESVYCPQDVSQYELKTSNKVVLWSNGSHWNLFEDDSLRTSNS